MPEWSQDLIFEINKKIVWTLIYLLINPADKPVTQEISVWNSAYFSFSHWPEYWLLPVIHTVKHHRLVIVTNKLQCAVKDKVMTSKNRSPLSIFGSEEKSVLALLHRKLLFRLSRQDNGCWEQRPLLSVRSLDEAPGSPGSKEQRSCQSWGQLGDNSLETMTQWTVLHRRAVLKWPITHRAGWRGRRGRGGGGREREGENWWKCGQK